MDGGHAGGSFADSLLNNVASFGARHCYTLVHPDCLDDEAEDSNENAGHGAGAGQEGQAPRGGTAGRPAAVAEVESAGATSSQLTPVVKYALCAGPQTTQTTYHDTGMMSRSSFERSAL